MEDEKQFGTCKHCGQTMLIQTVGEVSQARLDEIASTTCQCAGAELQRKIEQRKEDLERFLDKEVPEFSRPFFEETIRTMQYMETEIEFISIKTSDGWTTKFNLNNDGDLVINRKHSLSKRQVF